MPVEFIRSEGTWRVGTSSPAGYSVPASRLRRPEKHACGGTSAEAWGPTASPHADFGASGVFFHQSLAQPAPRDTSAEYPSGDGCAWIPDTPCARPGSVSYTHL